MNHSFPSARRWIQVRFDPLFDLHFREITISPVCDCDIILPLHPENDGIRAFTVKRVFEYEPADIEKILAKTRLSWNSMNYCYNIIWVGYIFKRPGYRGYCFKTQCLPTVFYSIYT
jgi:hypothetical protein